MPRLQQENERARLLLAQMQSELDATKSKSSTTTEELQIQLLSLKTEVERLTADNNLLKQELSKAVQVRSAAHNKVDEARRKLGLSPSEAQVFIKEFDESTKANAQLRKDLQQLQTDRNHLAQQCEQRSSHCMTLISENKRLVDQISDLRQQVVASEADAWRLRQQLSATAQRDSHLAAKREAASPHTSQRPAFSVRPASATLPPKQQQHQGGQGAKGKENVQTTKENVPSTVKAALTKESRPLAQKPTNVPISAGWMDRRGSREQPVTTSRPSPSSSSSSSPSPTPSSQKPSKEIVNPSPSPQPPPVDPDPLNLSVLQQAMQMRHERHRQMLSNLNTKAQEELTL